MKLKSNEIVFIIPVYNEGVVIRSVIESILIKFGRVICVNDGSTDNSKEEILETKAMLIDHPINMGQGAALQTGVEFARLLPGAKYFVTFDADGQHRLEDVEEMIKTLKSYKVDIVMGSRFLGSTINMPKAKLFLLKLAIKFSNITSGLRLTDTHNGLRVFNKKVLNEMQITMPDMAHASELLEMVRDRKWKYMECPVTIEYTAYSRAKGQTLINAVNIGFDTLLRKISK